jgi:solute carrier family 35 protein E3
MPPSNDDIELKSDLEAQKDNLLSPQDQDDSDDGLTTARSSISTESGPIKSAILPDGAVKTSQKSNQTSFLIWTVLNTLATIAIVSAMHTITSDRHATACANTLSVLGLYKQENIR